MDYDLKTLRQAAHRILARDPELRAETEKVHDPRAVTLVEHPDQELKAFAGSRADEDKLRLVLETIVSKTGRPVLTIRDDDFAIEFTDLESEVWRDRLSRAGENLRRAIPAVGRVEVAENPSYSWLGTAWLIQEDIVVTNRHVANEFATQSGNRFIFKTADRRTRPMSSSVDFRQEAGSDVQRLCTVQEILHIEPEPGPDVALLRLARPSGGARSARPIRLIADRLRRDQFVAAIGYPARDSRVPDQATVLRLFGDIYDKKRLAPGQLLDATRAPITHDCSTLGGNSGSVLIDLETGDAVGLHFAGLYLEENYAVAAEVLRQQLSRLRTQRPSTAALPGDVAKAAAAKPGSGRPRTPPPVSSACGRRGGWKFSVNATVQLSGTLHPCDGSPRASGDRSSPGQGEEALEAAVAEARRQLANRADVVGVRSGYRFRNRWITNERAVVVLVKQKLSPARLRSKGIPPLPERVLDVPVDVTPASPFDLLHMAAAENELLERSPDISYVPPTNVQLREVDEQMQLICHAGPDAGWPRLSEFLNGAANRLTVGMYDFTAPHVIDGVRAAVEPENRRFNLVIQHNSDLQGPAKENDIPDETVVADFEQRLGNRFTQAWAVVSGPDRIFASSYHIKVAVRDGRAFWISSGSWQSSNQPEIDPVGEGETGWEPLEKFNREWHAIVHSPALADQYEKFLLYDLNAASRQAEEAVERPGPTLFMPPEYFERRPIRRREPARYFEPLVISRRVRVQPLLTPDNYQGEVLRLIQGAREKVYFQNQSLSPLESNDPGFQELLQALCDKQQAGLDVRIIIRGDFDPRPSLEMMQGFGFDMTNVRVQNRCHNKGIVIDSDRAVVGSHNWTNQGTLKNRDASLIFYDPEIARYYERILLFDWEYLAESRVFEDMRAPVLAGSAEEIPSNAVEMTFEQLINS